MRTSAKAGTVLPKNVEWILGAVLFVGFIAAQFLFGISAAVKVLGVACVITGLVWFVGREVPVGIESRRPSFFVRGWPAMLSGVAMILLGIVLLLYSPEVACFLGWADGKGCP